MKKTTVSCARCGRTILPYRSVLPSNEAMDVCGACGVAVADEEVADEEVADLRAEIEELRANSVKVLRALGVEI